MTGQADRWPAKGTAKCLSQSRLGGAKVNQTLVGARTIQRLSGAQANQRLRNVLTNKPQVTRGHKTQLLTGGTRPSSM